MTGPQASPRVHGPRRALARMLVLCLLTAGLVLLIGPLGLADARTLGTRFGDLVEASGPWAVVLFALLALAMVPRAGIATLSGVVFGAGHGATYALIGVVLGAVVAFLVGRGLGRPFLLRWTRQEGGRGRGRLAALDAWVGRNGFTAVLVARFLPVLPFGPLNVAFGTTRVRPTVFTAATALGVLPTTVLFAAAGASANATPSLVAAVATSSLVLGAVVLAATALRRRAAVAGTCGRRATPAGG